MRGEYLVVAAKQKLATDPRIGRNDLEVRVGGDHEVVVLGDVASTHEQESINEVLLELPEVKRVHNHTRVRHLHSPHAAEHFPTDS